MMNKYINLAFVSFVIEVALVRRREKTKFQSITTKKKKMWKKKRKKELHIEVKMN